MPPFVWALPYPVAATRRIPFSPSTLQRCAFGYLTHPLQLSAINRSQLSWFIRAFLFQTGSLTGLPTHLMLKLDLQIGTNSPDLQFGGFGSFSISFCFVVQKNHNSSAPWEKVLKKTSISSLNLVCSGSRQRQFKAQRLLLSRALSCSLWSRVFSKCRHAHHQQRQPWLQQPVRQWWQQPGPHLHGDPRDWNH